MDFPLIAIFSFIGSFVLYLAFRRWLLWALGSSIAVFAWFCSEGFPCHSFYIFGAVGTTITTFLASGIGSLLGRIVLGLPRGGGSRGPGAEISVSLNGVRQGPQGDHPDDGRQADAVGDMAGSRAEGKQTLLAIGAALCLGAATFTAVFLTDQIEEAWPFLILTFAGSLVLYLGLRRWLLWALVCSSAVFTRSWLEGSFDNLDNPLLILLIVIAILVPFVVSAFGSLVARILLWTMRITGMGKSAGPGAKTAS